MGHNPSSKMYLNKFTLSFTDILEKDFRIKYFHDSLFQFRISFLLVTFLYAVFGYLDNRVTIEYTSLFHAIRFFVVVPIFLGVFLLSFCKCFIHIWQELLFICFIVGGAGITLMTVAIPLNYAYYLGLMLVFSAGYFFISLRFLLASIAGLITLIIFDIGLIFFSSADSNLIFNNNFFFISANVIGMFAAYNIEYYKRKDFFFKLQLDKRNAEIADVNKNLESKVEERTKELSVLMKKAEESDRLKSAFLANMSHEIRTPLNGIIGFSELLEDEAFEPDQKKEFIRHITTNGNNLLNIISDIMDISKIESGEIKIRSKKMNVKSWLENIHAVNQIKAKEKKLELKTIFPEFETEQDVFVFADPERLFQVINNLISNALKFTSEGFIEIGYRLAGEMVEFHVKDPGIGISSEYHRTIFDRFRQVETSNARSFGGNGLGLAISKNLIELMGGKIWVESELGNGSTFYFTLPKP